jgi:hypothetical protein
MTLAQKKLLHTSKHSHVNDTGKTMGDIKATDEKKSVDCF